MRLSELCQRLLLRVKASLVRGGLTERQLARRLGFSQPHLHNLLKGARGMTLQTADRIMARLEWTLADLLEPEEIARFWAEGLAQREPERALEVDSLTESGLSRSRPRWPVPEAFLRLACDPILIGLAADPSMATVFGRGDLALADQDWRADAMEGFLHLMRIQGMARLRWLRRGARKLYVLDAESARHPALWQPFDAAEVSIRGRVIAIARQPEYTFREPVPPPAAN